MSKIYRNPFAQRASEKIADDETFLRFFSPASLHEIEKMYKNSELWNNVIFFQSPPGAGKTSLLRLFTPSVLKMVYHYKGGSEEQREIYNTLKNLGVFDETYEKMILTCGVYLNINRDFTYLDDFDIFDNGQKRRIFMALLNARIILTILKSIIELLGINKDDLANVSFSPPCMSEINAEGLSFPCTGLDLFYWAAGLEDQICDALDNFSFNDRMRGNSSLFTFSLFKAEYFSYDGKPICGEFLFELDDAHRMTTEQRRCLIEQVVETRNNSSLWIAEREDILSFADIVNNSNKEGRDYEVVRLDKIDKNYFKKITKSIADKRSEHSQYGINLLTSLDDDVNSDFDKKYQKIINDCLDEINETAPNIFLFWFEMIEENPSYKERAEAYKAISIFTKRNLHKDSLPIFPFSREDYKMKINNDLLKLASQLLCSEHNMPLYYGQERLVKLSTGNIEQFIDFSSQLYEKLISKAILSHNDRSLSASEQDTIIKDHSRILFDNLRRLANGVNIQKFLDNLITFCHNESSGRASYDIVSGFAIFKYVAGAKSNYVDWYNMEESKTLREVIRICLANNLLFKKTIKQGDKGENWDVFYLNRWLCAYKNIPLKLGGWRKLTLNELNKWLED